MVFVFSLELPKDLSDSELYLIILYFENECQEFVRRTLKPTLASQRFGSGSNMLFNRTFSVIPLNVTGLTTALIFYGNNTLINSTLITGNFMAATTLNSNAIILDNYNVTEGFARTNDPIWFSQSNSNGRHIASNLTTALTNIQVTLTGVSGCTSISKITYTSNTGAYNQVFQKSQFTCDGTNLILTLSGIETASSSNELLFEFTQCDVFTTAGNKIILLFAIISIIAFCIIHVYRNGGLAELGIGEIIWLAVSLIVVAGLFLASGQQLGSMCGVIAT